MNKIYDELSIVLKEASRQFAPLWKLNNEKCDVLVQYCSVIDSLAEDFDAETFQVEVDEISMKVIIILECNDVEIEHEHKRCYELIKRADSFRFTATKNNTMIVKFVFPSVWDKVC